MGRRLASREKKFTLIYCMVKHQFKIKILYKSKLSSIVAQQILIQQLENTCLVGKENYFIPERDNTLTSSDGLPSPEFTITPIDFLSRSNSRVATRRSCWFHHSQQPRLKFKDKKAKFGPIPLLTR